MEILLFEIWFLEVVLLFEGGDNIRFFVVVIIVDLMLGLGRIVCGDFRSFLMFIVLVFIKLFLFLYLV